MSIPQLKNPKQLSYSGMRKQVRELARRMNILTEMTAETVDATANPKFTFSDRLATLDVPDVGEVVVQIEELEELFVEQLEICEEELAQCLEEKEALEAIIEPLEKEIAVICEKFVPPNGTFLYRELNSSRVGDYRTYSYSVGSLELRPEVITSPSIKNIQWTESANVNYSYDLQISTNTVSYNGPRVSIGASDIIVKNPAGSIVTSINTLLTGTYTVLVNFSANLGNLYPAPDYFPIGEFTISQTAPGDLPNSDTVIGYTDYGCP